MEVTSLYEEHAAKLLKYAAVLAGDREAALDAVQEVFLQLFAERTYGRSVGNPRAWLYRVLRNHLLDRLETAAVRWEVQAEAGEQMPDLKGNPETLAQRAQTVRHMAALLTPRELDCLRLRAQGFSYEEIAEVLGVRVGTVGSLLARAYGKLRANVNERNLRPGTADALGDLLAGGQVYSS
jgi:RNA polymerase sigma-70 factor, ECF subfamily